MGVKEFLGEADAWGHKVFGRCILSTNYICTTLADWYSIHPDQWGARSAATVICHAMIESGRAAQEESRYTPTWEEIVGLTS